VGVVRTRDNKPLEYEKLPVGKKLMIIPHHSCLTAACFEELSIIDSENNVKGFWKTAPRKW
jgi:D-serine deaminase-like pyridoxal phosphate-dependent protein